MKEQYHIHEKGKRVVTGVIHNRNVANEAAINYQNFDQNGAIQV